MNAPCIHASPLTQPLPQPPVAHRTVSRVGVLGGGLVYSGYLLGSLTVLKDPKRFELEYLQQVRRATA